MTGATSALVAADDKTPLKYHIEKYDSTLYEAYVWVKVPDRKARGAGYFNGSITATPASRSRGVTMPRAPMIPTPCWSITSAKAGSAPADATAGAHNAENAEWQRAASLIAGGCVLPDRPE